ncbi:MAG: 4-alpha-glucanotransferase [Candidatus Melainabacteria bacterium]|nr:MAG: 4-alpha-glucanotransferase [Candidatus Melainabacteria bacterium]
MVQFFQMKHLIKLLKKNKETQEKDLVNFENTVLDNSPFDNALKEAYQNFKKSDNSNIKKLKEEFESYKKNTMIFLNQELCIKHCKKKTMKKIIRNGTHKTRIYIIVMKSREADKNKRIEEIKAKHSDEIEFVYFKEFLAEKNLKEAKEELNSKNLKLMGDCLIGFSKDEQWAHPKAFADACICSADWGLRALDYSTICDENSESNKLLKRKVELFAKRYDAIRFDVGWSYVKPILYCKTEAQKQKLSANYKSYNSGYILKIH